MRKPVRLEDLYLSRFSFPGRLEHPCEDQVLIEGLPAARLATPGVCGGDADLVKSGAAMVLIGGLPAARAGDATLRGGVAFGPGAAQVLLGGPTFSLPSVITLLGDAEYQSKVLRDLYFISTTRSGKELLARLERAGQPVFIQRPLNQIPGKPLAGTGQDPLDSAASTNQIPCGSNIYYDPDYYALTEGPDGEPFFISPQEALMHESVHALTDAEGTTRYGNDPFMEHRERTRMLESQAIGLGTYEGAFPTENSFREDLGLKPPRGRHSRPDERPYPQQLERPNYRPGRR